MPLSLHPRARARPRTALRPALTRPLPLFPASTHPSTAPARASTRTPLLVRTTSSTTRRVVAVRAQAPAAATVSAPTEAAAPYGVFRLSYDVNNVST